MQTEISHRHIQLFEYVVHDVLIAFPRFLVKEEIELEWKARGSRIQLANHIKHVGVNLRKGGQVAVDIAAESGEIYIIVGYFVHCDKLFVQIVIPHHPLA